MATTVINLYNAQATPDTDIAGENLAYNAKRGRLVIDQETERLIQWGYQSGTYKHYVEDIDNIKEDEMREIREEISSQIHNPDNSMSFFHKLDNLQKPTRDKNLILVLTYGFLLQ